MSEENPRLWRAKNVTILLGMILVTIVFLAVWMQRHPVRDRAAESTAEPTNTR